MFRNCSLKSPVKATALSRMILAISLGGRVLTSSVPSPSSFAQALVKIESSVSREHILSSFTRGTKYDNDLATLFPPGRVTERACFV